MLPNVREAFLLELGFFIRATTGNLVEIRVIKIYSGQSNEFLIIHWAITNIQACDFVKVLNFFVKNLACMNDDFNLSLSSAVHIALTNFTG